MNINNYQEELVTIEKYISTSPRSQLNKRHNETHQSNKQEE